MTTLPTPTHYRVELTERETSVIAAALGILASRISFMDAESKEIIRKLTAHPFYADEREVCKYAPTADVEAREDVKP